jgi:hypothetical protein
MAGPSRISEGHLPVFLNRTFAAQQKNGNSGSFDTFAACCTNGG